MTSILHEEDNENERYRLLIDNCLCLLTHFSIYFDHVNTFCNRNGGEIGHLSGRRITQELPCAAQILPQYKDDCRLCHYDCPGLGKAMDFYGDFATLDQSLGECTPADLSGRCRRNSNMDKGEGFDGRTPGKVYVFRITTHLCFMLGMLKKSSRDQKSPTLQQKGRQGGSHHC